MQKEVIIEDNTASLYYYPEHRIIHHSFHKFIFGDKFREVLMTGAELFEKHGCHKWLSDDRNNPILKKEDLEWGSNHWKPKVLKAGWKYWAIILPDKETGKLVMKPLIEEYKSCGVIVEIFGTPEEAFLWLKHI